MSNFFLSEKSRKKKKVSNAKRNPKRKLNGVKQTDNEKNIAADSESEYDSPHDDKDLASEESDNETAQGKRLRLAKEYLAQLEDEKKERGPDLSDEDVIGKRLQDDVLEKQGTLQKKIAENCSPNEDGIKIFTNGHKLSLTCLCISSDEKSVFTGSKDCSIIKWNIASGVRECKILGRHVNPENKNSHTGHIFAIATSPDGQYLVSGGADKFVRVWKADNLTHVHNFKGHKGPITGLAFRQGCNQLFSASKDRSVKIWSLDEMAFVDTLFGHEDAITAIDSMKYEQAVSSGGRDASVRLWKVATESQLVFNGPGNSIDCLKMINEKNFVSGADDGSLSLWSVTKKKPSYTVASAHGSRDNIAPQESWLTSLATVRNTDLLASGSSDSCIRFWRCCDSKSLTPLFTVPVVGFVNALEFSKNGHFVVAAIGQEHRLGRWWRIKEAKNCVLIIPISRTNEN